MIHKRRVLQGFTLIELSIVLVIIGLIVGGVLVGRDLIAAAAIRAQISQIEKYQTAVNTFRGKYGFMPGDIPDPDATKFGFMTRGAGRSQGDGDGAIECPWMGTAGVTRLCFGVGEAGLFWRDLSTQGLVDGSFNYATCCSSCSGPGGCTMVVPAFIPKAAIGQDNYVVAYAAGFYDSGVWVSEGGNYFGIQNVTSATTDGGGNFARQPAMPLTVTQAYNIDKKMDDGLPQTGSVVARFATDIGMQWSSGGAISAVYGASDTSATAGSATTCFDNSAGTSGTPGVSGATQHYSVEMNNGMGVNCALSFKLQ